MKPIRTILTLAILAMPLLAPAARADNVSASQISAAGHGRRPILSNRPSREIYHRNRYARPHMMRHHYRRHRY